MSSKELDEAIDAKKEEVQMKKEKLKEAQKEAEAAIKIGEEKIGKKQIEVLSPPPFF